MRTPRLDTATDHLACLDGMRGIAAILVVFLHATIPFYGFSIVPHGSLAVDFFFCLSGFVIARAYGERLKKSLSLTDFIRARLNRLYPMVLFGNVLGCAVLIAHIAFEPHWLDNFNWIPLIVVLGFLLIPSPVRLGPGWSSIFPINAPMWSLSVELVVNIVYARFILFCSHRTLTLIALVSAMIYFSNAMYAGSVGRSTEAYLLLDGAIRVVFPFTSGVMLSDKFQRMQSNTGNVPSLILVSAIAVILVLPTTDTMTPWFESTAVIICFPAIVWFGAKSSPPPRLAASYRLLGRISYPLYLVHAPLLRIGSHALRAPYLTEGLRWSAIFLEIAICISVSFIVAKYYDEPVRAWLSRLHAVRARPVPDLATTGL